MGKLFPVFLFSGDKTLGKKVVISIQGRASIRYKKDPAIRYKKGPSIRYIGQKKFLKGPSIRYTWSKSRNSSKMGPV